MGELAEKQMAFTQNLAKLIQFIKSKGYECALKEVYRPPKMAEWYAKMGLGTPNSLHCAGLAADLAIFLDGKYLTLTEHYRFAGEYWKTLDPRNRWGGDFKKQDGNHFSMTHEGRA